MGLEDYNSVIQKEWNKKNIARSLFQYRSVPDTLLLARQRNKRVFRGHPGTLVRFPPVSSQPELFPS